MSCGLALWRFGKGVGLGRPPGLAWPARLPGWVVWWVWVPLLLGLGLAGLGRPSGWLLGLPACLAWCPPGVGLAGSALLSGPWLAWLARRGLPDLFGPLRVVLAGGSGWLLGAGLGLIWSAWLFSLSGGWQGRGACRAGPAMGLVASPAGRGLWARLGVHSQVLRPCRCGCW